MRHGITNELTRTRILLREVVEETELTRREIERRCHWHRGKLRRILSDRTPLQMEDLLLVLQALEIRPGQFWGRLYLGGGAGMTAKRNGRSRPFLRAIPGTGIAARQRAATSG